MTELHYLDRTEFLDHNPKALRDRLAEAGFDRSAAAVVREQANVAQFADHEPVFTESEFRPLTQFLNSD